MRNMEVLNILLGLMNEYANENSPWRKIPHGKFGVLVYERNYERVRSINPWMYYSGEGELENQVLVG